MKSVVSACEFRIIRKRTYNMHLIFFSAISRHSAVVITEVTIINLEAITFRERKKRNNIRLIESNIVVSQAYNVTSTIKLRNFLFGFKSRSKSRAPN